MSAGGRKRAEPDDVLAIELMGAGIAWERLPAADPAVEPVIIGVELDWLIKDEHPVRDSAAIVVAAKTTTPLKAKPDTRLLIGLLVLIVLNEFHSRLVKVKTTLKRSRFATHQRRQANGAMFTGHDVAPLPNNFRQRLLSIRRSNGCNKNA
jgi:hypothetical protein